MRDVLALQIFGDRGVMRGADRGKDQRHLVALHQPPRLLHGFRRRVAVIQRNQIDLAPVDAATLVDHLEIPDLALAERAERGHRAAVGHGLADADFGGGDAAHGLRGERRGRQNNGKCRARGDRRIETHFFLHFCRPCLRPCGASMIVLEEVVMCRCVGRHSSGNKSRASTAVPSRNCCAIGLRPVLEGGPRYSWTNNNPLK